MKQMEDIRPRIELALEYAGYVFLQQSAYGKWSKGRGQNVWFSKQVVRTNIKTQGSEIVKAIAGAPNGSVSEAQQGSFDSWYTDGYTSRGTAAL